MDAMEIKEESLSVRRLLGHSKNSISQDVLDDDSINCMKNREKFENLLCKEFKRVGANRMSTNGLLLP